MDHEHLGAAVGQDVASLLRREMPVDRHGIGAEMSRRHVDLEGCEVVAQHQRHAVVLSDAQGAQAPGGARGIGQDLRPAAEAIARSDACLHRSSLCRFS
jgi:hypothetical protein